MKFILSVWLFGFVAIAADSWSTKVKEITTKVFEQLELAAKLSREGKPTRAGDVEDKAIAMVHQIFKPGSRFKATPECRFRKTFMTMNNETLSGYNIAATCAHDSVRIELIDCVSKKVLIQFEDLADSTEFLGVIEIDKYQNNRPIYIDDMDQKRHSINIKASLLRVEPAPSAALRPTDGAIAKARLSTY